MFGAGKIEHEPAISSCKEDKEAAIDYRQKDTSVSGRRPSGKCRKDTLQIGALQVIVTYWTNVSKFVRNCIQTRKRDSNVIMRGAVILTHCSTYWEAKGYLNIRGETVIIS